MLSSAMFSEKEFAFVSNLRFISSQNFMLSSIEHEKKNISSGPGPWEFALNMRRF